MDQERLPRRILEWCPSGRRRKGRPRNSWMLEVTTGMREWGIGDLEWVDREVWRKKINLLKAQNTSIIFIYINNNNNYYYQ